MSARSARMRADRIHQLRDACQRAGEKGWVRSEADAKMPVHLEVIAWHHEYAVLHPQPLDQRSRIDVVVVPHESNGACLRWHVVEGALPGAEPIANQGVVSTD